MNTSSKQECEWKNSKIGASKGDDMARARRSIELSIRVEDGKELLESSTTNMVSWALMKNRLPSKSCNKTLMIVEPKYAGFEVKKHKQFGKGVVRKYMLTFSVTAMVKLVSDKCSVRNVLNTIS